MNVSNQFVLYFHETVADEILNALGEKRWLMKGDTARYFLKLV